MIASPNSAPPLNLARQRATPESAFDRRRVAAAALVFACASFAAIADPICTKGNPKTYEFCCNDYDPPELRSHCWQLKKQTPAKPTPVRPRVLNESRFSSDCPISDEFKDKIDDAFKAAGRKIVGSLRCQAAYGLVLKDKAPAVLPKLDDAKFALAEGCEPLRKRLITATESDEINENAYSWPGGDTIFFSESLLRTTGNAVTCSILHEVAHLAGASGDMVMEAGMEAIHRDCECPR